MNSRFIPEQNPAIRVRAAWISDIHLGNRDCKAGFLLEFLQRLECDILYLLGDIIDLWAMSKNFHWTGSHSEILRTIIRKSREGCRVFYIPGNHDSAFREYIDEAFGTIEVREQVVHIDASGRRFLVTHGDEFDHAVRFSPLIHFIGDHAYDLLLFLNRCNLTICRWLQRDYWSLAGHIKQRIGKAMKAITIFRQAAMERARKEGYDGIICGHIHHPDIYEEEGIRYCNDGDWIENCSALVEQHDGKMEIVFFSQICNTAPVAFAP
jgi:UDP-2,3-diacylglucosamine pyrophosphatase LpxH